MTTQGVGESSPLFTVIIPTKNRAQYLYHTLRTCTMQEYERLEIIVSDDGSTEKNREIVEEASQRDSRVRFISHGSGIGMRDNFELALAQAKPGYVIALGGDDGLLPGGIEGMRDTLRDTGTELLTWPAPIYTYPNVRGANGQLAIYHTRDTRVVDSQQFLARQAKNLHYLSDIECPMFYVKGVASTKLVDRVRSRTADGRFYSCPTPDGYSGIVLAGETPRFAFSSKPFALYGLSPDSQGLAYLSNEAKGKEASQSFMQSIASRPMHPELASQPYSPLITLMTVDYLLTARDLPGWAGTIPPIDYRQVLLNSLSELAHALYGEERMRRELAILNQIAEYHGLGAFFLERARNAKRNSKRDAFEGTGINTNAFFVNGATYGIRNIFDAAYAAKFLFQAYSDMRPSTLAEVLTTSVMYRLRAMGKGAPFPPESEWKTPLAPDDPASV